MSDESPPPPALRLKPRLRPEGGETPPATPPAEAAPATPPPAATGEAPKIRLRPRIMAPAAETPAAPAATAAAAPAPAPAPAPAVIPASGLIGENPPPPSWAAAAPATPPAPPPAEGAPKIRLKPSGPAPAAAAPEGATVPATIPAVIATSIPTASAAEAPVPPAVAPAGAAPDGAKFKLKPKVPPLPVVGAPSVIAPGGAPVPGVVVPAPLGAAPPVLGTPGGPVVPPISGEAGGKAPPPFPVVAPPKSGTTAPPIPHIAARAEIVDPAEAAASGAPVPFFKKKAVQISGLAALLVLGGGFVAWQQFGAKLLSKPAPAPAPAAKQTPPPAAAPAAGAPAMAQGGPTPSETMNNLAKMPAAAINKAQGAVNARNASGQTDVAGALGEDVANRPAIDPKAKAAPPATRTATASRPVSAGISATTRLEVGAVEPTPAFSAFVANAKISSVLPPTRAFINDKMTRTGDTVEAGLGIVFDSIDSDKRQIIFRDKTGATVARRY